MNIGDCAERTCGPFGECKDLLKGHECECQWGCKEVLHGEEGEAIVQGDQNPKAALVQLKSMTPDMPEKVRRKANQSIQIHDALQTQAQESMEKAEAQDAGTLSRGDAPFKENSGRLEEAPKAQETKEEEEKEEAKDAGNLPRGDAPFEENSGPVEDALRIGPSLAVPPRRPRS